ncbi:hypothetical protein QVD17_20988 [Tagetes erecta]|uniref:Uncharacterized protein n=1 Tax=Tagetes erecta TaxID=13708 RepID=A0AAD8KQ60_TARER|nr:hypothetical protein QVD17_20988 [Tagetes erecta]
MGYCFTWTFNIRLWVVLGSYFFSFWAYFFYGYCLVNVICKEQKLFFFEKVMLIFGPMPRLDKNEVDPEQPIQNWPIFYGLYCNNVEKEDQRSNVGAIETLHGRVKIGAS